MNGIPSWALALLIKLAERFLTPELVKHLEDLLAQAFCCKLKGLADAMAAGQLKDALEAALAVVAQTLGVDLSKCPA